MNRDLQSLLFGAIAILVGALGMVLTTSWIWPGIGLALGLIGFTAALVTPTDEP